MLQESEDLRPNALKKEYMAPAKGTSALDTEAWAAKPWAEKSIPVPNPGMREMNIQDGMLSDCLNLVSVKSAIA